MEVEIIFKKYPREVQLSKAQRPIYYRVKRDGTKTKVEPTNSKKLIPNKFFKKGGIIMRNTLDGLKEEYQHTTTVKIGSAPTEVLCDENGEPRLANATTANTPKMHIIKGNDLYSTGKWSARHKVVKCIGEYGAAILKQLLEDEELKPVPKEDYPIEIIIEIHDTINNPYDKKKEWFEQKWDGANLALAYEKVIPDLLANNYTKGGYDYPPVIVDDDRLYVRVISYFVPLAKGLTHDDRYIRTIIKPLTDPRVTMHPDYIDFHNGTVAEQNIKKETKVNKTNKQKALEEFLHGDSITFIKNETD